MQQARSLQSEKWLHAFTLPFTSLLLSHAHMTTFLICYVEVIIITTFLGYWENYIKHLKERSFENGKILFDSNPLEGFLGIHTNVHIYTHVWVFFHSTYGF